MQRQAAGRGGKGALLVGAIASAAGFLTLAVMAAGGELSDLDRGIHGLVQGARHPLLGVAMQAVSTLGDHSGLVPLIVLGSVLLWRPRRRLALILPGVMAGAGVLQLAAKWAIDRPRPNLDPWGFPSGHVLSLVVFLGLVCYVIGTSSYRRRWRHLGFGACAGTLLAVAFSRLYLEAHWLSDVAGGFTVGLAYLLLVIVLVEAIGDRRARSDALEDRGVSPAARHSARSL
jgi:undecaprenyl-diphosphatase